MALDNNLDHNYSRPPQSLGRTAAYVAGNVGPAVLAGVVLPGFWLPAAVVYVSTKLWKLDGVSLADRSGNAAERLYDALKR